MNTRYRLSINVKAEDLEGGNGPRFALNDASSGYSYVLTDPVLGTIPWTEQTAEFTTSRDATALIFRVLRSPARMLIRGRILIDDVRLEEDSDQSRIALSDSPPSTLLGNRFESAPLAFIS